jgi:hypothetical protein
MDFYVPREGLIVEFDESQHFTMPRAVALEMYPATVREALGFDTVRWVALCRTLNKRDPSPIDRDEQRAWLDTLRDFAPLILGRGRTVRLFARDNVWCEMRTAEFRNLLEAC